MKNDNISEIVHLGNTHISKKDCEHGICFDSGPKKFSIMLCYHCHYNLFGRLQLAYSYITFFTNRFLALEERKFFFFSILFKPFIFIYSVTRHINVTIQKFIGICQKN